MSGGAVVLLTVRFTMPSSAPPNPAIPADNAKIVIFARAGEIPDVRAATSELRTASMARPLAERWRNDSTSVSRPKITSSPST